jgi:hypothetical protein
MFVRIQTMIAGLFCGLVVASATCAQEPEHISQFFEKGQWISITASSARNFENTEFLSVVILDHDEFQRAQDSKTLSSEELVKKYSDLKQKIEETTAVAVKENGNDVKLKTRIYLEGNMKSYRVLAAKPSYLLVEDTATPPRKTVFAMDKIKTVTWSRGLFVEVLPARSVRGQE